jgi:RHS repeat-associated protein
MTRDYTYSATGDITTKDTEHGNYTYQYDELRRLTEAVNPLGANEAYSYDALGNRLTAAGVPGDWRYNANNELLGYDNVSYAYDNNGNTTRKTQGIQETNYIYDVEDRLIRVKGNVGDVIAEYYYDPFGRRLWKEVDGIRTYFVYSDEGLIGEYDESGTEIRGYGYAPNSQWSTDPLFYKRQGQYYWYQNDHLGTPQKIIETSGRVVWSALYDSFGNVQIETSEITNNLRFAGQYHDAETGLHYNLNRHYDPTTGRYLRTDPYGEGLNLYAYVFNNPNSLIDPLGLCVYNKVSGWVHGGLAVIGLVPLLGIVPDLIDAGLYLLEAEYSDAALAGIAAIPIAGYFGRGAQYGVKFVKWGSKYLPDAINFAKKANKLGKNLYQKIFEKFSPKTRIFWSGSSEARAAAESFAKANGGKTLEMTLPGRILNKATTKRTYPFVNRLWDKASKNFAKGAKGSAEVFQSGKNGVRFDSVWRDFEYPELIKNGTSVKYHVTQ